MIFLCEILRGSLFKRIMNNLIERNETLRNYDVVKYLLSRARLLDIRWFCFVEFCREIHSVEKKKFLRSFSARLFSIFMDKKF